MKIYSNTSNHSITDYIGQDIWVLCTTPEFLGTVYVHPISGDDTFVKVNYVEEYMLQDFAENTYVARPEVYFDTWTSETEVWNTTDIEVCVPLTIFTTEDIKEAMGL